MSAEERWGRLAHIEEKFYRQKSSNTKFFHSMVQTGAARNMIRSLVNTQGEVLRSQQDIKNEAVSYFQNFLQSQDLTTEDISVASLQILLTYRFSTTEAA
ncbi:hypothetical protein HID58_048243, partial [Brassica napus]